MSRARLVVLLVAALMVSGAAAIAGEKQIAAVKELAGTWQGWTFLGTKQTRVTMVIREDGSYEASTPMGEVTVGKYYLENGKLRYRSSRTEGAATVSEDKGKTFLTVVPEGTTYETGKTEYERMR
jgi:hypothetical protein